MSPRIARAFMIAGLTLAAAAAALPQQDIAARLEAGSRSAEDRARDAGRKPDAVLAFLGIEPGMTVVDLIAAGGWYTEVLSLAVGPKGKVYAQNTDHALKMREGANDEAMKTRLADERLPNVERLDRELDALDLPPESVDAALTALNFHDVYHGAGPDAAAALLRTVYTFLVPGGVLGIIDHAGGQGDDAKLHRIDEALVVEAAKKAGFEVESSDLLRNAEDDRTRNVFDPALRGHTDRFLLRLRKPPAPATTG